MLLLATQCALIINRIFDIADTTNDRRVSREEWNAQLGAINEALLSYGYAGDRVEEADFEKIDADNGGMILLDEAVWFFLRALTNDAVLLTENEEGC